MNTNNSWSRRATRGFTLLELLIVFVIIAILIGVTLLIGQKVSAGSKARATQNVLQSLDQALEAFVQAKGGTSGRFPDRFIDAAGDEFPLADAVVGATLIPSGELVVELLRDEPQSAQIIQKIPAEFTARLASVAITGVVPQRRSTGTGTVGIELTQIKDGWGRPVRFVHPAYHGIYGTGSTPVRSVQVRRGGNLTTLNLSRPWQAVTAGGETTFQGEGDGGLCAAGRPYFYSAGQDGNPATVEDNVYSVRPTFDAAVKAAGQ